MKWKITLSRKSLTFLYIPSWLISIYLQNLLQSFNKNLMTEVAAVVAVVEKENLKRSSSSFKVIWQVIAVGAKKPVVLPLTFVH